MRFCDFLNKCQVLKWSESNDNVQLEIGSIQIQVLSQWKGGEVPQDLQGLKPAEQDVAPVLSQQGVAPVLSQPPPSPEQKDVARCLVEVGEDT